MHQQGFPSHRVAIVGAYESERRKAPGVHPYAIQAEAVLGALRDAGLALSDVDGFCTTATFGQEAGWQMSVAEVAEYIGIRPRWFDSTDIGGAASISQAGHAALAIEAGLADVVVVSYGSSGRSSPLPAPDFNTNASGPGQWEVPYGPTTVASYALAATRHMHEYGTTPEQLAAVAVQLRENAARNPHAMYREPITVDDVLSSPMISDPLHRLDCCVVSDSGGAFVMVSAERARDLRTRPVFLDGWGEAIGQVQMNQMPDFTVTSARESGRRALASAGLSTTDIDCAQIYDSFTITVLLTLESLGFCGPGEGGGFIESGAIGPGGSLPINTDGGGLSSNHPGRRGTLAVIEAVRQLRGESPGVTIPGARSCLVNGTGGTLSATATLVLTN
ncbi:acetyl-CoA acetyltransferase [Leucobacter allii]|uniref:Acetyl-CoA acetyltransferase n=1 Tax=Leucobacter allii TaxID=2932247 RepID=A0ABY4FK48_9MICO|nr:acetyl-CoA acetyltransferase [Leucobacter allii]UOQ56731.1 acetyl-CoA acetyltransferase [Leucobacter allii]UOR01165.1 acetyl-CoA acetyltransferase [Leucobacter allii]